MEKKVEWDGKEWRREEGFRVEKKVEWDGKEWRREEGFRVEKKVQWDKLGWRLGIGRVAVMRKFSVVSFMCIYLCSPRVYT